MTNSFSPQKNCIIYIDVRDCSVTKGFASMEDEWNINALLLLPFSEPQERLYIVDNGPECIFVANEIKPFR